MKLLLLILQIPGYYAKKLFSSVIKEKELRRRYARNYKKMLEMERSIRDLLNAGEWEYVDVVRPVNIPKAGPITKNTVPHEQEYVQERYRKKVTYEKV